jgi:hypothetical protein
MRNGNYILPAPKPSCFPNAAGRLGRFHQNQKVRLSFLQEACVFLTWFVSESDVVFAVPMLIEVFFPASFLRTAQQLTVLKAWSQSPQALEELKRLKALVSLYLNPAHRSLLETGCTVLRRRYAQ